MVMTLVVGPLALRIPQHVVSWTILVNQCSSMPITRRQKAAEVSKGIWLSELGLTRHHYGISALLSQTSLAGNQWGSPELSAVFSG